MNVVHIVGKKNQGKTTLVAALVRVLSERGIHVGTLKHCHKEHELDTPGKDSHQHRLAGARTVAAVTPNLTAVFQRQSGQYNIYDAVRGDFADCSIVMVEGDANGPGPKVEVWRAENGVPPLAVENASIGAVVTDDAAALAAHCRMVKVLERTDVEALADYALAAAEEI